jgi:uncharacterized protein YukE
VKKLSKDQVTQHLKIGEGLRDAHEELDDAVKKYNEKVNVAFSELQTFVETLNAKITEANDFVENIHSEQEAFFDEKSDKWQEGDAGSAYQDWMTQWGDRVCEEVELSEPEELYVSEIDFESFDGLETECLS